MSLSWSDPEFSVDPYRLLADHRDEALVYDHTLEGWLALRFDDIAALLRDPRFAKNPLKAVDGPYTRLQRAMAGSSMMFMDDPDRGRVRGLARSAFTRGRVEAMRPRIRTIADGLLDAVADEPAFDLMAAYAAPLSIMVIAALLGIEDADREQFKAWSEDLAQEYDPALSAADRERIARSRDELVLYFIAAIDDRTREPRDDLITALTQAHHEHDQLSLAELVSTLVMLLVAGNLTTTDLIGNGVLALLEHPEQLALLRRDRSLLPAAVEEILRYDSPVTTTDRIATADLEIGGCPVRKGEWVWAALVSANHDPAAHPRADRFDITRDKIEHLAFGIGSHFCLGAPLARLEAQIALDVLLDRCPDLALDPESPHQRRTMPAFRGLTELRVTRGAAPTR